MRSQPLGVLDNINSPSDVKDLPADNLDTLCSELRDFLIKNVSKTGGHLASNLGVVELTVAIHRVFDTSKDRLVFDIGHQSYVHMLLTGRKPEFETLRQFGGLAGFPKPTESIHDAFVAGHASTSISAALGIARARTLHGGDYSVLAVIGDGALTGGLAYEGFSNAGESGEPLVLILNDNGMSITDNVGGIARYLSRQRMKPSYAVFKRRFRRFTNVIPGGRAFYRFAHKVKTALKQAILHCSMFEEMGLVYVGPVDGHNIQGICEALEFAKRYSGPVVVHVLTKKGRGYEQSEKFPEEYHGVSPFDYKVGLGNDSGESFSSVFGETITDLAARDTRVCAITASMASGTGLTGFAAQFPDRFFDVGIAEGHAAVMAAGMASRGAVPVFAVYSTFLQRAYDMLIHDIAISGLHVVFAVDRAGLVPGDGETHQGVFDAAFLSAIPGITILCPSSFAELRDMLSHAIEKVEGPVAVRYPRGGEGAYKEGGAEAVRIIKEGSDFTLLTYGISINTAVEAASILESEGISIEIIKLGCIAPIDMDVILSSVRKTERLLVLEECSGCGSIAEHIAASLLSNPGVYAASPRYASWDISSGNDGEISKFVGLKNFIPLNTGDKFVPCGDIFELRKLCGIDSETVCEKIREAIWLSFCGCDKEVVGTVITRHEHGQNTA